MKMVILETAKYEMLDNIQPSLKTDDENHRFFKFLLRMSVIVSLYNYVATSSDTFEFKL